MTNGRAVAYSILFLCFGLPALLTFVGMPLLIYFSIEHPARDGEVSRRSLERALVDSDMAFGGSVDRILGRARALKSLSAAPEDASVYNRTLVVAVITQTSEVDRPKLNVDFSAAETSALLIITDRPVILTSKSPGPSMRAKLAVESLSLFDVEGFPKGLLAGFRVRPFGASRVTSPMDAASDDTTSTERFCDALKIWTKHYRAIPGDVRVWEVIDPTQIRVVGTKIEADAARVKRPFYASDHCRHR